MTIIGAFHVLRSQLHRARIAPLPTMTRGRWPRPCVIHLGPRHPSSPNRRPRPGVPSETRPVKAAPRPAACPAPFLRYQGGQEGGEPVRASEAPRPLGHQNNGAIRSRRQRSGHGRRSGQDGLASVSWLRRSTRWHEGRVQCAGFAAIPKPWPSEQRGLFLSW